MVKAVQEQVGLARQNPVGDRPRLHYMKIGILTSGGDCPGLNAVIRAIVRKVERIYDGQVIGFHDAWKGVLEDVSEELTIERCRGLLPRGGTILGTSRIQPYQFDDGVDRVKETQERYGLDGFIVIGGDGSMGAARDLKHDGINVIGVPKSIDNDIAATEMTFGFDTAVHVASAALDRIHTTAEAHDRVLVVEVMGRNAGHIAVRAGIAGGATITLIPEVPFDIDQVADALKRRHAGNRYASIIVVAEGALPKEGTMDPPQYITDRFGHQRLGGIGDLIASELEGRTGIETRSTSLGYIQRGGTPTAFDRILATRFGTAAADAAAREQWGNVTVLKCDKIELATLEEATKEQRLVDLDFYNDVARPFFAS